MAASDDRLHDVDVLARRLGLSGPASLTGFPKYLQIETVSRCNAHCTMCPVDEWTRSTRLMEDALFDRIAAELADHADWIEEVCVQLDGEPLIDKKLAARIGQLKQAGIKRVVFATNGSLMTPERGEALLAAGLDAISFSIDGATAETYERIRRGLNFNDVVTNVMNFIGMRNARSSSCRIRIRMVLLEENRHEFADFRDFWNQRLAEGDDVYGKALHHWANWLKDYGLPQGMDPELLNRRACHAPWSSMVVLSDGRVPLCCSDFNAAMPLGDANRHSLADIWQGEVARRVRDLHSSGGRNAMPMCVDCTVWDESARQTGRPE